MPSADQLANAMAKMSMERYQRISATEYVAHAGKVPLYHPNLSEMIDLEKRIGLWIRSSILDLDLLKDPNGAKKRSGIKRFFVQTAKVTLEECLVWPSLINL
jgi:hypothetical protein